MAIISHRLPIRATLCLPSSLCQTLLGRAMTTLCLPFFCQHPKMSDFTIWLVTSVLIAACFKDNNIFATLIFPLFFFSWFLLLSIRSHSGLTFKAWTSVWALSYRMVKKEDEAWKLRASIQRDLQVIVALKSQKLTWGCFFPLNKRQADVSLIHCLRCVLVLLMFAHSEETAAHPAPNFPRGYVQKVSFLLPFASEQTRQRKLKMNGFCSFLQFYMLLTLDLNHQEEIIPLFFQRHCQQFNRQCLNLCPLEALLVGSLYCSVWVHWHSCLSLWSVRTLLWQLEQRYKCSGWFTEKQRRGKSDPSLVSNVILTSFIHWISDRRRRSTSLIHIPVVCAGPWTCCTVTWDGLHVWANSTAGA